jgi:hypothetical protein
MFLYVCVAYADTMWIANPGQLQDAAGTRMPMRGGGIK